MEQNPNLLASDLAIDGVGEMHLKETARWARFLGIVGFVLTALIAVMAFAFPAFLSGSMRGNPYATGGLSAMTGMITVIYLLIAVFMFAVSYFIFKFGTATKAALLQSDQAGLNEGLLNLKRCFRLYGIVTVIYIAFIVLAVLVTVVSGI